MSKNGFTNLFIFYLFFWHFSFIFLRQNINKYTVQKVLDFYIYLTSPRSRFSSSSIWSKCTTAEANFQIQIGFKSKPEAETEAVKTLTLWIVKKKQNNKWHFHIRPKTFFTTTHYETQYLQSTRWICTSCCFNHFVCFLCFFLFFPSFLSPASPRGEHKGKELSSLFHKFPPFFILQHKQIHTLPFTH